MKFPLPLRPYFIFLCLSLLIISCQSNSSTEHKTTPEKITTSSTESSTKTVLSVKAAKTLPVIDGFGKDACWQNATWHPIDQLWVGDAYTPEDFTGRYKLTWSKDYLYILAEITDDKLVDTHDGLEKYWDDDCLEIFIDENHSGGIHQYNHNAFAYHIALDYAVADIGLDSLPHYYNDHVKTVRTQNGQVSTWEVAMSIYDDTFKDGEKNTPVHLTARKKVGFALAYCDNDTQEIRENFIGSVVVPGTDKNRGWIDAGIFGSVELVE